MKREAVFARQGWYPTNPDLARQRLQHYLHSDTPETEALAVIAPHAGWTYSGPTAGKVYAQVKIPNRVVVLCPMHQAMGPSIAVWPDGDWDTPLGTVEVDSAFAQALLSRCPSAKADYDCHRMEHAIEIQLPFLKMRNAAVRIVPIRLGRLSWNEAKALGDALAELIEQAEGDTLIVASSDMSHESEPERVAQNDALARQQVVALDPQQLMDTVQRNGITMCGYVPATVAMVAALKRGAQTATEVAYTTSAEISGRSDYVVGYLAARFDR